MAACEKCWADAYIRVINNPMKSQTEHYQDLLEERKNNPCSEIEQKYGRAENAETHKKS